MDHVMHGSAIVVGGARGLGEAITTGMLRRGVDKLIVVDREMPEHRDPRVSWMQLDLVVDNVSLLSPYVDEASYLVFTAGIGRLNAFDTFDVSEVGRTMRVNAVSAIEVLQLFSRRLASRRPFYAAAVTSISGLMSSPLYAVYSASKAALSRYIESVNAELAGRALGNRVLEVAPGRIEGTGFHGSEPSGPEPLMPLADQVVDAMLRREVRLIPDLAVYGDVLRRYQADPAGFGISSYQYKLAHAPLEPRKLAVVGYLSGTFDLFHVGHLNLLRRARGMCDRLVVGVHPSGAWKGKETFIPLEERKAMLEGCRYVDEVVDAPDEDDDAWDTVRFDRLFVGSDYEGTPRFERYERVLGERGVKIVYFPYTKGTSSTQIRSLIHDGRS